MKLNVHPDIRQAETLPAAFYQEDHIFEQLREQVFRNSWQWIGQSPISQQTNVSPLNPLDGFLREPMLMVKNPDESLKVLSNVCTHRANLLHQNPTKVKKLICPYHGRQFDLNGKFQFMPEFTEAEEFPRDCDHLRQFDLAEWGPFLFTSVSPQVSFAQVFDPMIQRISFLPLKEHVFRPELSKTYLVNAHWALYCDNYLEGFHIPFVHKDLNAVLDYGKYSTELFDYGSLQVGYSGGGEEIFDLPKGHPDFGQEIAAYYYWIFPNMMFNFYPWGLSVNIVVPISKDKTRIQFLTYVYDESKLEKGAGALLDKVEREDEFVVESVHKGLQSSAYKTGRFSPTREQGVHHFHRLLAQFISS